MAAQVRKVKDPEKDPATHGSGPTCVGIGRWRASVSTPAVGGHHAEAWVSVHAVWMIITAALYAGDGGLSPRAHIFRPHKTEIITSRPLISTTLVAGAGRA